MSDDPLGAVPVEPALDTDCDNDVGRSCRELWPDSMLSWCPGCTQAYLQTLRAERDQLKVERAALIEQTNARGEAYDIASRLHEEAEAELVRAKRLQRLTEDNQVRWMQNHTKAEARAEAAERQLAQVRALQLNPAQERAVQEWAADDRLWTTQETVAFHLRTFAREILALVPLTPCTDYRPDHNGECLNCDEPADAHEPEADKTQP